MIDYEFNFDEKITVKIEIKDSNAFDKSFKVKISGVFSTASAGKMFQS